MVLGIIESGTSNGKCVYYDTTINITATFTSTCCLRKQFSVCVLSKIPSMV